MTSDITAAVRAAVSQREPLPPLAALRALRERRRLTQDDLARIVGVTPQALSNWERGLRSPRGATRMRYLAALDALMAQQ